MLIHHQREEMITLGIALNRVRRRSLSDGRAGRIAVVMASVFLSHQSPHAVAKKSRRKP
jgi:hypothetical protein